MTPRTPSSTGMALALAVAAGVLAGPALDAQRQVPGAFRSRVVLVPVDVRVLDRNGDPVTDLTERDFTVYEDGVRQQIGHFAAHAYVAATPPAPGVRPPLRRTAGLEPETPAHRTFLIVLGRGRLNGPAGGMDALIDFVAERLLPQDYVGLVAYNRTSALTTDHARVVRFLERYRDRHEAIETLLQVNAGRRGSTRALFGRRVTSDVQRRIDSLFDDPALPETRTLPPLALDGLRATEEDWRGDLLDRSKLLGRSVFFRQSRDRVDERGGTPGFEHGLHVPRITIAGLQDLEKLYVGIEYLRYLEGEKHLLFLSEDSLQIGRPEHHDSLAAVAADARVTISSIRTGGLPADLVRWTTARRQDGTFVPIWADADPFFASDDRPVASMTGGVASRFAPAARGFDRIDRATRFGYLIGYYPTNGAWDGRFRRIEIRVDRPGVVAMYRHGYYGTEQLVPYDRRTFLSHAWMVSAAAYPDSIPDVGVGLTASAAAPDRLSVEVAVDPAHLTFTDRAGRHAVFFELAVFASGDEDTSVGEIWRTADLSFDAADYARLQGGDRIVYRVAMPVTGRARLVKAVVYDYDADRLGTTIGRVR